MTQRRLSDDDLSLYLSGEASDALTADINTALVQDATLQKHVDDLRATEAAFVDNQNKLLSLAPKPPALPAPLVKASAWVPALGGLAAGLLIAGCVTWSIVKSDDPDWRDVVASYQSLYVTETLSGVTKTKIVEDAKLAHLSDVLGLDLTRLPEVDGLTYRRARQ